MPEVTQPGLGLKAGWEPGEQGWGDPMNENIRVLSLVTHLTVGSRTTALPGSPNDGDTYIVPPASGDASHWVAVWNDDEDDWLYTVPTTGMEAYVQDEAVFVYWSSTEWVTRPTGNSTIDNRSSNYTVVTSDFHGDRIIVMDTDGGDRTITLPSGLTVTEPLTVVRGGTEGLTIVAGMGVTLRSADNIYSLRAAWSAAQILPLGADQFVLIGDLGT